MGVSLFLVWQKGLKSKKVKSAVMFFGLQLALNAVWSPIFFGSIRTNKFTPPPVFLSYIICNYKKGDKHVNSKSHNANGFKEIFEAFKRKSDKFKEDFD